MKKLIILTACFVVISSIISFTILPTIKNNNASGITYNSSEEPVSSSCSSYVLTYVVKNFNGNIAVFEGNNEKPFKITDVLIKDLPYADQELLLNGIFATKVSEVNQILEDYCS